jgi:hypothetical protein
MIQVKVVNTSTGETLIDRPANDFHKAEFVKREKDGLYIQTAILEIEQGTTDVLDPLSELAELEMTLSDSELGVTKVVSNLEGYEYKTRQSPVSDQLTEQLTLEQRE